VAFNLKRLLLSVSVLVLLPLVCNAQQPLLVKRYPWDDRPNKCFVDPKENPYVLVSPTCRSRDWLEFEQAKLNFGSLMGAVLDYELLERAANEIGFSRDKFPTGEYLFEAVYIPLDLGLELSVGRRGPTVATRFVDEWSRAQGEDGYARLARALVQYHEAWRARGHGAAGTVTPEGWKLFYAKLAEANATLDSASPKLKQSGPWHELKLRLVFAHPELKNDRIKAVEAATAAWPDYVELYDVIMNFMHPRWGGSYDAMEGVAQMALKKTSAQQGAAIYAQVYERQFRADCTCTLADAKVDWPTMKQGFRDMEVRKELTPQRVKHLAGMACQMRDRDEARRLFGLYDQMRGSTAPEEPDACRLFASR
jgi:hypothetical protein